MPDDHYPENGNWDIHSLRVLIHAEMRGLRHLLDERDMRYSQRFQAQEQAVSVALASAKEATNKAEAATSKRFDESNQFRAQLKDQAETMNPRDTAMAMFSQHRELIDALAA